MFLSFFNLLTEDSEDSKALTRYLNTARHTKKCPSFQSAVFLQILARPTQCFYPPAETNCSRQKMKQRTKQSKQNLLNTASYELFEFQMTIGSMKLISQVSLGEI